MSSVERSIDDVRREVAGLKNAVKEIAEVLKQQYSAEETKRVEYIQIIGHRYYDTLANGIDKFMITLRESDPDAKITDIKLIEGKDAYIATIIYRSTAKVDFELVYAED